MSVEELENELRYFGESFVFGLATVLKRLDKKSSGKLINSLNSRLVTLVKGVNYRLEIYGEDYFDYVNEGRDAGKQPPLKKIEQWTKLKGIDTKFAYPIAKRIGAFGVEPTYALEVVLQEINTKALENKIDDAFIDIIDKQIKEAYKEQ